MECLTRYLLISGGLQVVRYYFERRRYTQGVFTEVREGFGPSRVRLVYESWDIESVNINLLVNTLIKIYRSRVVILHLRCTSLSYKIKRGHGFITDWVPFTSYVKPLIRNHVVTNKTVSFSYMYMWIVYILYYIYMWIKKLHTTSHVYIDVHMNYIYTTL